MEATQLRKLAERAERNAEAAKSEAMATKLRDYARKARITAAAKEGADDDPEAPPTMVALMAGDGTGEGRRDGVGMRHG